MLSEKQNLLLFYFSKKEKYLFIQIKFHKLDLCDCESIFRLRNQVSNSAAAKKSRSGLAPLVLGARILPRPARKRAGSLSMITARSDRAAAVSAISFPEDAETSSGRYSKPIPAGE